MGVHMNATFPWVQVGVGLVGTALYHFTGKETTWKKLGEVFMYAGFIAACFMAH
jgi:hypothetical protein